MSASEEIDLQLLHKDGEEPEGASYSEGQKPLEQPDDGAAKGAVNSVMTSRFRKISLTVLTLLSYTFVYAAMSDVTAFYAILASDHNVATYISGFVLGVPNLCLAVLAPLIGYFLPHLGLKFTQVGGLFFTAGSQVLFGFVSMMSPTSVFIAFSFLLKLAEGIGLAMFSTASLTVLTQLFLQRKGTLSGVMELSISSGYIVGVGLGGGLQEAGGFVAPLILFGGINLLMTPLLLFSVHPKECTSTKLPWRVVLKMIGNILFVILILCSIIGLGTLYSFNSFFGHFLNTQFGLSVGIIGVILLCGLVMNTLVSLFAGALADKLKIPRYMIMGGLVVAFVGCVFVGPATFITTPKLWLSIVAWVVFGIGIEFTIVPAYPVLFEAVKNLNVDDAVLASTLSGILVATYALGGFLGPIVGGALVHQVTFPTMALISGLILLIYALVLVIATVIEKIWKRRKNAKK